MRQTEETYDIRIARDGAWWHEGAPIRRMELVKLFAGVLRRDDAGDYWLITPAERGRIVVEDAPFVAVELKVEGQGRAQRLSFRTNIDQWVTAGPDHPITLGCDQAAGDGAAGENVAAVPYVMVRGGLTARIARSVFYDLAALATDDGAPEQEVIGVWSEGTFFPLTRAAGSTADPAA